MIAVQDADLNAQGLTSEEARRRLADLGPNEVDPGRSRSVAAIVFETMREPMFLLLVAAAAIYAFMGDLAEGLFLLGGAGAAIGLVIFQEARSEQALKALRQLAQPHSRLLRDGAECKVAAREIVPGDIVLAGEGERLPVDGLLVGGDVLSVDESVLTGNPRRSQSRPPRTHRLSMKERGPVRGRGTMSLQGRLSCADRQLSGQPRQAHIRRLDVSAARSPKSNRNSRRYSSPQAGWSDISAFLHWLSAACVAATYGLLRGDWPGGALAGITIAIALIPEEFPMVLAIFLALGAWRLASHNVLVRRSAVIETLGGATVLCVDKTGTLTENRMQVARLWTAEGEQVVAPGAGVSGPVRELLQMAALASAVRPVDPWTAPSVR